eukprot:404032_1
MGVIKCSVCVLLIVVILQMLFVTIWYCFHEFPPISEKSIGKKSYKHLHNLISKLEAETDKHGPLNNNRFQLSQNQIKQYNRDGFTIIKNALNKAELQALSDIVTHTQNHPNLDVQLIEKLACTVYTFANGQLLPELRKILKNLKLHHAVQQLMNSTSVAIINDIFHWNHKSCSQLGSLLHTHSDGNTMPFKLDKFNQYKHFGDNTMILWIAIDTLNESTMTMQISNQSHRHYSDQTTNIFNSDKYCDVWMNDLEIERNISHHKHKTFLDSFIKIPTLYPGDALIFHGLSYHRPIPACKGKDSCHRQNTRRITLRYIDAETEFKSDEPKMFRCNHPHVRRCPTKFFGLDAFFGCKWKPGVTKVKDISPVVLDINNKRQLNKWRNENDENIIKPPWPFWVNSGLSVHHETCGLEYIYVPKVVRRVLHRLLPSVQTFLFGGIPKAEIGEEDIWIP